jgi:hypothetical protein
MLTPRASIGAERRSAAVVRGHAVGPARPAVGPPLAVSS